MREGCEALRRLLAACAAREVTAAERDAVDSHVARCAACRNELVAYRRALGALEGYTLPVAPPRLRVAVSTRIAARRRGGAIAARPLRWALAVAGALAVVAAGATVARRILAPRPHTPVVVAVRQQAEHTPRESGVAALPNPKSVRLPTPETDVASDGANEQEPAYDPVAREDRAPKPRRAPHSASRQMAEQALPAFLDVRDQSGRSARTILQASAAPGVPPESDRQERGKAPPLHRAVIVAKDARERVNVGGRAVVVSGERGWDAQGRLALVRLRVDAGPASPTSSGADTLTPAGSP